MRAVRYASVAPEGPALLLPSGLLFGSRPCRTRPASGFLVSLVPFRDESLVRSRMALISDAPASRVIGLRGVAQLMAQMNLVGGSRRRRSGRLRSSIVPLFFGLSRHRGFGRFLNTDLSCYTALLYCLNVPPRRSINDSRNRPNRCRSIGSPYHRNRDHAPQKQEEDAGRRVLTGDRYGLIPAILSFIRYNPVRAVM